MRYMTNLLLTLLFLMVVYLAFFSSRALASDCDFGEALDGSCLSACQYLANSGVTRSLTWNAYIYGDGVKQACFGSSPNACLMDGFGSEICVNTVDGKIQPSTTCSRQFRHVPTSCPRGGSFIGGNIPDDIEPPPVEDHRIFKPTPHKSDSQVINHIAENLPDAFQSLDSRLEKNRHSLEKNRELLVGTQNLINSTNQNLRTEMIKDAAVMNSISNRVTQVIELVEDVDADLIDSTQSIIASGAANTLQLSNQMTSNTQELKDSQHDIWMHVMGINGNISKQTVALRDLKNDLTDEIRMVGVDTRAIELDTRDIQGKLRKVLYELKKSGNGSNPNVDLSSVNSRLDALGSSQMGAYQLLMGITQSTNGLSRKMTSLESKFDSTVDEITNPSQSFNSPIEKPFVGGVFSDEIVSIKKEIKDLETQMLEKMNKPLIGMGEMNFNTGTYTDETFVITRGGQDISIGFNLFDTLGDNVTLIKAVILLVASLIAITIIMTSGRRS